MFGLCKWLCAIQLSYAMSLEGQYETSAQTAPNPDHQNMRLPTEATTTNQRAGYGLTRTGIEIKLYLWDGKAYVDLDGHFQEIE